MRKNCTEICVFNYTTMKTQILIFFLAMLSYIANAQSVTIDPKAANPNLVEIKSSNSGFVIPKLNSSQRTSIPSPQKGLLVFDTTTNSDWYFNGSVWAEIIAGTNATQWQVNADNQFSVNTGKVGIGITPSKAKFDVNGNPDINQALFGGNFQGISIQTNKPSIGFNVYKDGANIQKYLSDGTGMMQEFDPLNGSLKFVQFRYGDKSEITSILSNLPFTLNSDGQFGSGTVLSNGPETKLYNNNFIKFGSDSPKVKYRMFISNTVLERGQFNVYNHYTILNLGVSESQILKLSVLIDCEDAKGFVPPNQCDSFYNQHCYHVSVKEGGFLEISHEGAASLQTYSKPFKVFIAYTE